MPIGLCVKCSKPVPDSFHNFEEVCECKDYRVIAKQKGWKLKFPNTPKHRIKK